MRQQPPERHSIPVLIIQTLLAMVSVVSLYALSALLPVNRHLSSGLFVLILSLATPVTDFLSRNRVCRNQLIIDYRKALTDLRYIRFAIAAGAAFSGLFIFFANSGVVFIHQLKLSVPAYAALLTMVAGCYWFSAIMGTRLTRNMSRSQSSMLAASLMLMGAVTCVGSGILTNGQSISGYLTGIILYTLGLGFFIPLCQIRALEHLAENPGKAASLTFSIVMLIAVLALSFQSLLPGAGTLPLSAITLVAITVTTLCLLGVDRERDLPRRRLFKQTRASL